MVNKTHSDERAPAEKSLQTSLLETRSSLHCPPDYTAHANKAYSQQNSSISFTLIHITSHSKTTEGI